MTTQHRRTFLLGVGAVFISACTNKAESESAPATEAAPTTTTTRATTGQSSTALDSSSQPTRPSNVALTPNMFDDLPTCELTAPAQAGPFPTKDPILRREIHEDLPGHPLRLGVRVVDQNCAPIPDVIVDVWHTDASGDYSEYTDNGSGKDEGAGSTFCRGAQRSDANGILEFSTIYPGWYEGRTVHIHATARLEDGSFLTTQLYLDESLTASIHETGFYTQFGPQDTSWADDPALDGSPDDSALMAAFPTETPRGAGTLALINLGVNA